MSTDRANAEQQQIPRSGLERPQAPMLTAAQSALYKPTALTNKLHPLMALGSTPPAATTKDQGVTTAVPIPERQPSDSGSMKLPSFSPAFSSFGRQPSFGRPHSMDLARRLSITSTLERAASGSTQLPSAPGAGAGSSPVPAQDLNPRVSCDGSEISGRPSFVYEDMETTYRDWHNGVFSSTW